MNLSNVGLESYLVEFLHLSPEKIDPEVTSKFEWFIKRTAVDSVTPQNKKEFEEILIKNDLQQLTRFISENVPDFQIKLAHFITSLN